MKTRAVVAHKQRLDSLFDMVARLNGDPELIAHWSRYLCVLVSGFIEASIRTIIAEYASSRSSPECSHFIGTEIRQFTNAKANKILDLFSGFGASMRSGFEQFLTADDEVKQAIDSIVGLRHQIAHGKDTGVSYVTVKAYYAAAVRAVEAVEVQFPV